MMMIMMKAAMIMNMMMMHRDQELPQLEPTVLITETIK